MTGLEARLSRRAGRPDEPPPFELCGPLPSGVTLLEASAGTGKTFTIASLVARYVAEGVPLDRQLVVTFTRMATGELRERVRERLVAAEEALGRALSGTPLPARDDVAALLATGPPADVAARRELLSAAVAGFDAATIETTHGFCLRVLTGLGVAGDVEPDTTLEPDVGDLLAEVVDDLYVRRFWRQDKVPAFRREVAFEVARAVANNPSAVLAPPRSDADEPWAMRRRLADAVLAELDRRKRAARVLTYDDVLIRLRRTLADPDRGPAACERLRARYQVVLIDEFQDTDPVQWEIVRRAFGTGASTLVLIGDPKQAIYAFRGADVHAYLDAAERAGTEATLGVNWRSDQGLVDAYDAIFGGASLGERGIAYRRVSAARPGAGLVGAPVGSPLRVRIARRDNSTVELTAKGFVSVASGRPFIAADVAADISGLLASGATVAGPGPGAGPREVRPGDVAVLVRKNDQAELVRDALHAVGVPAVVGGSASVFAQQAAQDWRRLLDALDQPTSSGRAASAALTVFVGWTAEQVANAGSDAWEDLHWRLHGWAGVLRRRGVGALLENVTRSEHLPARLLARPDGERLLTDVRHVGELLHAAAVGEGMGATAVGAWLRRRIADAGGEGGDEGRARRLESDAEAVQVLTIHRAKGLEFPVVYCPFLWDHNSWDPDIAVFHDPDAGDARTVDVGGAEGPDFGAHCLQQRREERGEDLRLLYVALTRARHQAVVWWAGSMGSRDSALARLLFSRGMGGVVGYQGRLVPTDDELVERLRELAAGVNAEIAIETATGGPPVGLIARGGVPAELDVSIFDRELDQRWARTSYTAITAGVHGPRAHGPRVGSEPEVTLTSDEQTPSLGVSALADVAAGDMAAGDMAAGARGLRSVPLLLAEMPRGARVGTFVHRVLEQADFTARDLHAELRGIIGAELERDPLHIGDRESLVGGLAAMIETPLGAVTGGLTLRGIGRPDRLDELSFELPLTGGDVPAGELGVADIAATLHAHLPDGDLLAGYPPRLTDPSLERVLRGYLTGSLDLVLRVGSGPAPRFVICDYKTNWLGAGDAPLTAWDYRPSVLVAAMEVAHYPLQAMLYLVALHRYLRWRLPGYDPSVNLGGVCYLFVRGMSNPGHPMIDGEPCGVFTWQPPGALVEALSDLFDRGGQTP